MGAGAAAPARAARSSRSALVTRRGTLRLAQTLKSDVRKRGWMSMIAQAPREDGVADVAARQAKRKITVERWSGSSRDGKTASNDAPWGPGLFQHHLHSAGLPVGAGQELRMARISGRRGRRFWR